MHDNKKIKIALVTVTLSTGGAERCAAILSHYFDKNNIEVHHIVFSGTIEYNHSGKVFHLIDANKSNSVVARFFRLKKYLKTENFDFIIDFRTKHKWFQEFVLHRFLYKNCVQTIHSSRLETYFFKNPFFSNLVYKKSTNFVAVCKAIETKICDEKGYKNVQTIYNPIDFDFIEKQLTEPKPFGFEYIVAAGSMNQNIKQFDVLISSYAQSILPQKNIKLVILGDGFLKNEWILLTQKMHLQDKVIFTGNVTNPFVYYANANYFVLTSKYEGFPMVLLEALACNTPVITYDCATGPNEIVQHNGNGILVENQNQLQLVEAMNNLVLNESLYKICKNNAKKSVQKFALDTIGNQWDEVFKVS